MDEVIVRALVIGAVFALLGIGASLLWRLFRSPSEGARRLKWVLVALIAVPLAALLAQDIGMLGVLAVAAVVGAIVWVAKGFKPRA